MYMEHVRKRFRVNAPLTPVIETIVKIVIEIIMEIIRHRAARHQWSVSNALVRFTSPGIWDP